MKFYTDIRYLATSTAIEELEASSSMFKIGRSGQDIERVDERVVFSGVW